MGTLTSWKPLDKSRPVKGLLYLYLYVVHTPTNALFIKLVKILIYIKIHNNIAPTCFGL